MINGLEGIPGSGKSYEAVVYHVLPQLQKGRRIITNLPLLVEALATLDPAYEELIELRFKPAPILGTWDTNRVDDKGNGSAFELFPPGVSPFADVPLTDRSVFGSVWDFYTEWKHPQTGQGPLFIIDECHVPFPVTGTDKQVVEWFKLHRHFNIDVLLCTQNFRDMNQPMARLIAMLIKVRKADILGKPDHYIRKVYSGYRGAVISTEERKYQVAFFGLYRSHSQGNSVAESAAGDVVPLLVKFKRFSRAFYLFTFLVCAYVAWSISRPSVPKVKAPSPQAVASRPALPALAPVIAAAPAASSPQAHAAPVAPADAMQLMADDAYPEPYAAKTLHLTGRFKMAGQDLALFVISDGSRRLGQVSSIDLVRLGYKWETLGDCVGVLRWKGSAKSVICDAPYTPEASSSNPVVLAVPAGSSTPTGRSDGLPVPLS